MDKSLILLDPEDEYLRGWGWNHSRQNKYLRARPPGTSAVNGKQPVLLHRLITEAKKGEFVDHVNGNPWDCRRANMRICDRRGNNCNRRPRTDSKAPYKGITQTSSGRWLAQIQSHKTHRRIGLFGTAEEAATAYDIAAIRLHGEFARTNGFAQPNRAAGSGG
jgi:hypothetical protein